MSLPWQGTQCSSAHVGQVSASLELPLGRERLEKQLDKQGKDMAAECASVMKKVK